jgi:hypothetical protein
VPPTPEQEGRDLVRCRHDLVAARRAARHPVQKQLPRCGLVFEGRKGWTLADRDSRPRCVDRGRVRGRRMAHQDREI